VVDRVAFFIAPRIIGSGLPAIEGLAAPTVRKSIRLENFVARQIGGDWLLEADVVRSRGRRAGARS
jgi:riboflavin biosynthesis pyrimidine reductase